MSELFLFTRPRFTARTVARVIGQRLRRRLTYQVPDDLEDLDSAVAKDVLLFSHGAGLPFGFASPRETLPQ